MFSNALIFYVLFPFSLMQTGKRIIKVRQRHFLHQTSLFMQQRSGISTKGANSMQPGHFSKGTNLAKTAKHLNKFDLKSCTSYLVPSEEENSFQLQPKTTALNKSIKIYVYELPDKLNVDILRCFNTSNRPDCITPSHCGMGEEISTFNGYQETGPYKQSQELYSVRNSHQFALETVLHHQMLHSPYRTWTRNEANMVYVPAYIGLLCLCSRNNKTWNTVKDLNSFLKLQPEFGSKPHIMAVAKIEREMWTPNCPLLKHKVVTNFTILTIEQDISSRQYYNRNNLVQSYRTISVPYPSYIHLNHRPNTKPSISSSKVRDVLVLLAASKRHSNICRVKIIDQFSVKTQLSYHEFMQHNNGQTGNHTSMVMLVTQECNPSHRWTTIPWMLHSTFCLQPPGDSPSRKSFYDAVLSGCIPVLFSGTCFKMTANYRSRSSYDNPYAFQRLFDYSKFTVIIPYVTSVYKILSQIPSKKVTAMQHYLNKIRRYFQYSVPDGLNEPKHDAMEIIFKELAYKLGL